MAAMFRKGVSTITQSLTFSTTCRTIQQGEETQSLLGIATSLAHHPADGARWRKCADNVSADRSRCVDDLACTPSWTHIWPCSHSTDVCKRASRVPTTCMDLHGRVKVNNGRKRIPVSQQGNVHVLGFGMGSSAMRCEVRCD